MDDNQGKWVTINGTHIFIKKGQSVEEAMAERQQHRTNNIDSIIKNVTYADAHFWYMDKETKKRVMPKKHFTEQLRTALENYPIEKADIEDAMVGCLNNKIQIVILQDHGLSDYNQGWERVRLNMDTINARCVEVFCHEMGHAMDNIGYNSWRSSTFVSPKHGKTMVDMLYEELKSDDVLENLIDEHTILTDLIRQVTEHFKDNQIDKKEYFKKHTAYNEASINLVDMVQVVYGEDVCKARFGYLPHPKPPNYFVGSGRGRRNAGTELFAELTANLCTDNEKRFYNVMKYYAPKTVEIYEEIMEEVKGQWKS